MDVGRWRSSLPLVFAAALALIVRLVYLAELQGTPLFSVLMGDSRQYDAWAQQIAAGQWLGTEVFYQAPLYPYSLAVVFSVAGHSLGLVRVIQAVLGAASCVLLGLAGRRFFNDRVGLIAGLLLAVYPPAIFFDGLIQKSSLDIFLTTLVLALLGEFHRRPHWKWLAASGAATAALVLNRENARILYPVLAAWLLFYGYSRGVPVRRRAAWTTVFLAASFTVLLPVGLRNYRVGGEFLLSTSQLGPNFYIGNNANASGSYQPLVPERGDPAYEREDATRLASKAAGRPLSPGEVSSYWLGEALSYIRSEPIGWLTLLGKKLLLTFNATEIPDTESMEAYADSSHTLGALLWLNLGVMLPFAALGAWVERRRWRELLVLYGMLGALAMSVAVFYVVARYRHPLAPIVLLIASAGVAGLLDAWQKRSRSEGPSKARRRAMRQEARPGSNWKREWMPGVIAAVAIAVVANLPIRVVHDETYVNLGSLLVTSGRPADAVPVLLKAVEADPTYAAPHYHLGLAYRDLGEQQAAIEHLATAIRLRPDHAESHNALGVALRRANRLSEALAAFGEAARLAPDSVETRSNLGLVLMEAGRPQEAVAEHERAVALAPDNPGPRNNLAGALQQAGNTVRAIAEWRKAIALRPDWAEAHSNLAIVLASTHNNDEAFRHFGEAVRLQPDNFQVRMNFARALCEAGRTAEGVRQYDEAAKLAPDSIEPLYLGAEAYARIGLMPEAVRRLEKALATANATGRTDAAGQIAEAIRQSRAMLERREQ